MTDRDWKSEYGKKLRDPRWQKLRLQVFERDGWRCLNCGNKKETLHVHHAAYKPGTEGPWDAHPDTLYTLCSDCHDDEWHEYQKGAIYQLVALLGSMDIRTPRDLELLDENVSIPLWKRHHEKGTKPTKEEVLEEFRQSLATFYADREIERADDAETRGTA